MLQYLVCFQRYLPILVFECMSGFERWPTPEVHWYRFSEIQSSYASHSPAFGLNKHNHSHLKYKRLARGWLTITLGFVRSLLKWITNWAPQYPCASVIINTILPSVSVSVLATSESRWVWCHFDWPPPTLPSRPYFLPALLILLCLKAFVLWCEDSVSSPPRNI